MFASPWNERPAPHPSSLRDFARDAGGTIAIITALSFIPLLGFMGLAVDGAMLENKRSKLQSVVDAATLAAVRRLQTTGSSGEATVAFNELFKDDAKKLIAAKAKITKIDPDNISILAEGEVPHAPFLMGVFGFGQTNIKVDSSGSAGAFEDLEISMMLDLSSSMTGRRFSELKIASREFVDILKPNNSTSDDVKIALAPFASGVNVGPYIARTRDPAAAPTSNSCVPVRLGQQALTDAPPGPAAFFAPFVPESDWPCLSSQILPLEANANTIQTRLANLQLSQGTEGEIGTAWSWYLLSPKWASIWPTASAPTPYNDGKTKKVVVLMTDGENFTRYFPQDEDADAHALALCDQIKANGITIYSVGVDVAENRAYMLLKACASDETKYLAASGAGGIIQAYRNIALELATVHLTN
jgi:hypothetical protein